MDALVIEGAFSSHEGIAYQVAKKYGAAKWIVELVVPTKYDTIECIDKIHVPKLIIHSTEDAVCPFYMGKDLYTKAIEPKAFWEIKGPHIQASNLYTTEFVEHFKKIID